MFDDLLRQLKRFEQPQLIPIQLQLDDDSYLDRRCPAEECGAAFKVLFSDWSDKVSSERATCAICGEVAERQQFNTPEQLRQIREVAIAHVQEQLGDAMGRAHQPTVKSGGFITMTWSYKPGTRQIVVPAAAEPVTSQRSACEACGCRYASVGAAFFCPACGHNSARSTFADALTTVRATMDLAERMPSFIEDRDGAANTARHLTENALVRVWSSFQRFAEAAYDAHPISATAPASRNAFQNLQASDALWAGAIGKTYRDLLTSAEHSDLVRLVQARHILAHKDGIVGDDYVARSGDHRYTAGQRLVVTTAETRHLADLAEKLAANL